MAFVRRRGNQLAIVAGERHPDTKQVEQRVLFTLFSREEALAALGKGAPKGVGPSFDGLVEHAHPGVKFDWKAIRKAITADLDHLPDTYEHKEARLLGRFEDELVAFARAVMLANPHQLASAGAVIEQHRSALEYLRELIASRLEPAPAVDHDSWARDNAFYWRYRLQRNEVPTDIVEHAAGLWERRELGKAEGAFDLIGRCFPEDPETWNYLGLIALERKDLATAEGHFRACIERGRRRLPRRVPRSSWWKDLATRPTMRGLRNLTLTLIRAGKYEEARALADRLETECADDLTAATHRAAIAMNTGEWKLAAESASRLTGLWPEEGVIEALARFEMGQRFETLAPLIHAAITHPRATRILLGLRAAEPRNGTEAADWNAGVHLSQTLHGYLARKDRAGRKLCAKVLEEERVAKLVARAEDLRGRWFGHPGADRSVLDELSRIEKREHAEETARQVAFGLGIEAPREPAGQPPGRSRAPGRARASTTIH